MPLCNAVKAFSEWLPFQRTVCLSLSLLSDFVTNVERRLEKGFEKAPEGSSHALF